MDLISEVITDVTYKARYLTPESKVKFNTNGVMGHIRNLVQNSNGQLCIVTTQRL